MYQVQQNVLPISLVGFADNLHDGGVTIQNILHMSHIRKCMESFLLSYIMKSFDFRINSCTLPARGQGHFSFRRENLSHS